VLRLIDRSEMTNWGRLFQTIGTAWQNARLVNSCSSCCRVANSSRVDAVASMVCKDESVMEVAWLLYRRGLERDQSKFVLHLVANWQPMQVGEDWSNVITPTAPSYDTINQLSAVSERLLRMSLTMINSVEIPTTILEFSTMLSSKKVPTNDCANERQPEIAIW